MFALDTGTTELQPIKFNLSELILRVDSRGKVIAVTRSRNPRALGSEAVPLLDCGFLGSASHADPAATLVG